MRNQEIRAALEYHEATKHSERSLRGNRHVLDFSNQPLPFKIYRGLEVIPLAWDLPERETPALDAIAATGSPHSGERIPDISVLARVLLLSAGITKRKRYPGGEILFRAYANTGALYHVDLYLITCDLQGLAAGVYHFGPHDFALHRLRSGDFRGVLLEASGENPDLARAPVILASASTYWRNAWKYQARSYRHCYWDGGTLHANLLAAAEAEALEPRIVMGFADAVVEGVLALDPRREGALTLVPLGRCAKPPPSALPVPMLRLETEPLSREEVAYPAIRVAHEASKLESSEEARSWRAHAMPTQPEPPVRTKTLPLRPASSAEQRSASLDRVIQRRGSTRAFDPTRSLRFDELSTALDRATRGLAADFLAPGASLLDLYLIVHAVDGLPPGAYAYRRRERALEPLREGSFRETAGRLGLFQELPAEAAVNVYSLAALTPLLERFGNRGYRAAQLEGGVTGGRLYLAAYAQGFGATGLTFLDDEVTDFFSPHAAGKSVLFLTALGHADRARLS
ncbi:MAG TPA: SagB/ThcOx family dehydrogenase [Myxococcota bacterium]|nr:SagB/ThcOx family dehydrogenase [Myxococcota bacterium]